FGACNIIFHSFNLIQNSTPTSSAQVLSPFKPSSQANGALIHGNMLLQREEIRNRKLGLHIPNVPNLISQCHENNPSIIGSSVSIPIVQPQNVRIPFQPQGLSNQPPHCSSHPLTPSSFPSPLPLPVLTPVHSVKEDNQPSPRTSDLEEHVDDTIEKYKGIAAWQNWCPKGQLISDQAGSQ
ncbi:unnamed protein product, partial [Protopolystoma xenopodis]